MFGGETYKAELDKARLLKQLERVFETMQDGVWRTLKEIRQATPAMAQETSLSARVRDFRKVRHGGYLVERRRRGGETQTGLWEYRLDVNAPRATSSQRPEKKEILAAAKELFAHCLLAKQHGAVFSVTCVRVLKWLLAGAPSGKAVREPEKEEEKGAWSEKEEGEWPT